MNNNFRNYFTARGILTNEKKAQAKIGLIFK